MDVASATGRPIMRALFVEFPDDDRAWDAAEEFMFGPDILVSPVTAPDQTYRSVYLPEGTRWRNVWTGGLDDGGKTVVVDTPIDRIPVFVREDAADPAALLRILSPHLN